MRNINIINNFLMVMNLMLLLLTGLSAFTLFDKNDPIIEKRLELVIIIFTMCFQLLVISRIKKQYTSPELRLYFIHPAFYINMAVISFFFLPCLFYMFNSTIGFWWVSLENNLIPIAYFCLSIIILNILFVFIDKKTTSLSGKTEAFDQIIDVFRQRLPILIVFYVLAWVTRILTILAGTYSIVLAESELHLMVKMQYPLLYPAYMFFNSIIYFPVVFVLWILYFTAFKTNKNYKLFMILMLIADVLYFLPAGGKLNLLQPILAYGLAGLMFRQKVLKKLIIVGIVLILSLPVYNTYRIAGGTLDNTAEGLETAELKSFGENRGYLLLCVNSLFRRAEAFASYFYFTQKVEDNFLYGATYASITSGLLPDYLLPLPDYLKNKSLTEHVRDQGIIGPDERLRAGASAPWGEFYLNFGYAGVVIGVPLLGMFCLLMFRNVLKGRKFYNFLIYSYLPFGFLFLAHAQIAVLISPLIEMAVVLFIVHFITKLCLKKRISLPNKGYLDRVGGAY